jgi:hypothetical protein
MPIDNDWDRAIKRADVELRPYLEIARAAGWRVDSNPGGQHPALYPPDKTSRPIPVPTSAKKGRSHTRANFRQLLRRAGLNI